jgi:hypothetical protein
LSFETNSKGNARSMLDGSQKKLRRNIAAFLGFWTLSMVGHGAVFIMKRCNLHAAPQWREKLSLGEL